VLLAAVAAGRLPLARAIEALTTGPARVLGTRPGRRGAARGLVVGAPADLVVVDVGTAWAVTPGTLASKGKNTPLLGRELPGRVLLTVADGRLAWRDEGA
jgi:dihydroorotase